MHSEHQFTATVVLAFPFQDSFYLLQVIQVMAGHHAHNVGHGLITAFRMHAVVFPECFRNGLEQVQVCFTQRSERGQRCARIAASVIKRFRPEVLVISLDEDGIGA
jgi:hypothetical protein